MLSKQTLISVQVPPESVCQRLLFSLGGPSAPRPPNRSAVAVVRPGSRNQGVGGFDWEVDSPWGKRCGNALPKTGRREETDFSMMRKISGPDPGENSVEE